MGLQPLASGHSQPNAKLERLRIAVAPLGWDTNFTWLQSRSGQLDKRPALEYLIGIDRHTGAYIPELAEKWEMAPDGKSWTVWLRKGVKFHENWGEFTAKDVRHAVFLITQPESVQTDAGFWRPLMGIGKTDTVEEVAKKVEQGVEIIDDYKVVFHLTQAAPEFVENISANTDLVMESKARWDAGGKELYGQKVVGTGPFEFVERKVELARALQTGRKPLAQDPGVQGTRVSLGAGGGDAAGDADRPKRCTSLMWTVPCRKTRWPRGCRLSRANCRPSSTSGNFGGMYFATPGQAGPQGALCEERGAAGHEPGHQPQRHSRYPPGW